MKHGSLFSGIGGFDLGFERAGMKTVWQVEKDRNCAQILESKWPSSKRYADVKECGRQELEKVDIISGGFPCQDLSVAGRRAGLDGERSGLWWEFARIIDEIRPRWVVIENVPGLLSSNGGEDMEAIFRTLEKFRYLGCWRVLNAQYFGVAQRRRRVFIVGYLGDGRAAEVLFEREGGAGNLEAGGKEGEKIASTLRGRSDRNSNTPGRGGEDDENLIIYPTLDSALIVFSAGQSAKSYGIAADENVSPPLRSTESGTNRTPTVAWNWQSGGDVWHSFGKPTLQTRQTPAIGVRRLMPIECERLQGFPDGWTEGFCDTARYRMLGNAVCVPVAEWIGRQIVAQDDD